MTRAELIADAREWAEGEDSDRWSDEKITLLADVAFRREWHEILKRNPDLRTATRTVTPSVAGVFALSALNSGAGDALERLHRIRWMKVADVPYEPLDLHERPNDPAVSAYYGWYRDGNNVQLSPASAAQATVKVTHTPPRPSELSTGNIDLTFIDTYEQILSLEIAALMLSKGGTESSEAKELKMVAADLREAMYDEIGRDSARPVGFAYDDSPESWGGQ